MGIRAYLPIDNNYTKSDNALRFLLGWIVGGLIISWVFVVIVFWENNNIGFQFRLVIFIYIVGVVSLIIRYIKIDRKEHEK